MRQPLDSWVCLFLQGYNKGIRRPSSEGEYEGRRIETALVLRLIRFTPASWRSIITISQIRIVCNTSHSLFSDGFPDHLDDRFVGFRAVWVKVIDDFEAMSVFDAVRDGRHTLSLSSHLLD